MYCRSFSETLGNQTANVDGVSKKAANAFNVVKECEVDNSGRFEISNSATCELILQGENLVNRHAPYTAYYALVPADFVFDETRFKAQPEKPGTNIRVAGKEIEIWERAISADYYLQSQKAEKYLTLRSTPVRWAYRRLGKDDDQMKGSSFDSFLNDSALLEIDPREILCEDETTITVTELESAMSNINGRSLNEILHINDLATLAEMAARNVCVKVGDASGYMVPSRVSEKEFGGVQSVEKNDQQDEHAEHFQKSHECVLGMQPADLRNSETVEDENQLLLNHISFVLSDG